MTLEQVTIQVVTKYLRKGNMARCLRDILPSSGLSKDDREKVAEIVHDVVRWKKLYEHIMVNQGTEPSPRRYITLAQEGAQAEAVKYPFEYRYSCSSYVASVLKEYGDWAEYLNEKPPTTLCVNWNRTTPEKVMDLLHDEHMFCKRSILNTAILTTSVSKYSKVLREHYAHVQDENSQLIAYLSASLGKDILDFCAGNGGKSLAMASFSRNTKELCAYDTSAAKRAILQNRCNAYRAKVQVEDHLPAAMFDMVLVDAPCTGLGATRRNPEAKYINTPADFPTRQLSILLQAEKNVRKHGFLLYSVCTITPEETSQVVHEFINQGTCTLEPLTSVLYKEFLLPTKRGAFTVLPHGDLFYLSLLRKE